VTSKQLVVYCDEPSHTSEPVRLFVTDADPVFAPDVFVVAAFDHDDGMGWQIGVYGRHMRQRGGKQHVTEGGQVVPTRDTDLERLAERLDKLIADVPQGELLSTHQRYRLPCDRCGLELRRSAQRLDDVFDRLADNGITGISLRTLIAES
jgi:hypothetical protein